MLGYLGRSSKQGLQDSGDLGLEGQYCGAQVKGCCGCQACQPVQSGLLNLQMTHSCIHSFVHAFVRSVMLSFMHAFIHSYIHSLNHASIHAFNVLCIQQMLIVEVLHRPSSLLPV